MAAPFPQTLTYRDRAGRVISRDNWKKKLADPAYAIVREEAEGDLLVRAVWIGVQSSLEAFPALCVTEAFDNPLKPETASRERGRQLCAHWHRTEGEALADLRRIVEGSAHPECAGR